MGKHFKLQFPHGYCGQQPKAPDQVVELGVHASEALLNMYRGKGVSVTECKEDGSPLEAVNPAPETGNRAGNVPPSASAAPDAGSGTPPDHEKTKEARLDELLDMKRAALDAVAGSLNIENPSALQNKDAVIEAILAAEFPEEITEGNGK